MSEDLKYGTLYQHLVHNEESIRQSAMRRLRKFISAKDLEAQSIEDDDDDEKKQGLGLDQTEMMKIWRGLFYCFWMSDKDDIQQEFARNLACSIHLWSPYTTMTFLFAFLETMADRWSTIDHHRLNKYLSLIRRMLEASFIYLRIHDWDNEIVATFVDIISQFLRQLPNQRRGLAMQIIEMYLPSLAVAFGQDAYFNEINIDNIIEDHEFDNNMTLEDIYYNQYVFRKEQRSGKEAQERFHARRAARRENAAPLDHKYTKAGRKEASLAKGKPVNPENGKLLYTNPIAYLINRKVKKQHTVDTPDLLPEVYQASRENLDPIPDEALIQLVDVLLNCYKLSTKDNALHDVLQDNFRLYWNNITKRFIDDAEYQSKGEENPQDEIAADALGHTAAASLRALSLYLREKALATDDLPLAIQQAQSGKKSKPINIASLGLPELPASSKTRRVYNAIAAELEAHIARLATMGIDFEELEARGMMMGDGEGEFDGNYPPGWMGGEEGELSDADIQRYLAAMNGEGEFADDSFEGEEMFNPEDYLGDNDEDDEDGEYDLPPNDDELGYPPNMMDGEGEYDFMGGEEGEIDMELLQQLLGGAEGEFDYFDGEGEDGEFDMGDDDDEDGDEEDDDEDEDEVTLEDLRKMFGPALKLDKFGQPILSHAMRAHIQQWLHYKKMKRQAESVQSTEAKQNTKKNQQLQEQYVPTDKTKWNYGYEGPLSDSDDDRQPNMKKRKNAPTSHHDKNKKQKTNDVKNDNHKASQLSSQNTKQGKSNNKGKVVFDTERNQTKVFSKQGK